MKIDKLLCIGGLCEGFTFCDIFDKRILGPVDNIAAKNFKSLLNLFSGKLFDDVLNDNISKKEYNTYRQYYNSDKDFLKTHDDFYLRYYDDWRSGHINFELKDRKISFEERIYNFIKFNADINSGSDNLYYLYTISEYEYTLTESEFEYTCNNLPKQVLDRLIILGGKRNPIPEYFKERFRCIEYNINFENWESEITKT